MKERKKERKKEGRQEGRKDALTEKRNNPGEEWMKLKNKIFKKRKKGGGGGGGIVIFFFFFFFNMSDHGWLCPRVVSRAPQYFRSSIKTNWERLTLPTDSRQPAWQGEKKVLPSSPHTGK